MESAGLQNTFFVFGDPKELGGLGRIFSPFSPTTLFYAQKRGFLCIIERFSAIIGQHRPTFRPFYPADFQFLVQTSFDGYLNPKHLGGRLKQQALKPKIQHNTIVRVQRDMR